MFIVVLSLDVRVYFSLMMMVIGLFMGIKVFIWMMVGRRRGGGVSGMESEWVSVLLVFFMVGGLMGLVLSNAGVDVGLYDIYYVVV